MVTQLLQPGDVLQRRLDILGVSNAVSFSSANFGVISPIFKTGNIGYPSPSKRVFVAYVIVQPSGTIIAQSNFSFGANPQADDWSTASTYDLGSFPFPGPIVLSPYMNVMLNNWNPPVYGAGLTFAAKNGSAATTTVTATFTAVGWCE